MEQSLLKSNFVGRDGFLWWIGQVAPESAQKKQLDKEGWGNRRKVRIMGYHPSNEADLSNDDLPWAQVLLSATDGSGAGNYATSIKVAPGDSVFGFFMDGDNAQLPVIIGVFGKTKEGASKEEFRLPFQPFTGYTSKIENDGSKLKENQTNEQTTEAQESPVHLPPQVANSINKIAYSSVIGDTLQLGTTIPGSKIDKISTEMQNAIKFLQDLKSYPNLAQEWIDAQVEKLCEEISKKIQGISTEIVGGVVNGTYEKLQPALEQGAKSVYNTTYATVFASTQSKSAAHLAGAKAQAATIEPVKQLQKLIPCLIGSIIDQLGSLIGDMVCALLKNVANVVNCVIDQFVGGILNAIIDLITAGMSAVLGVLGLLLSFSNFNLLDTVKNLAESLLGISLSLNCGEEPENPEDSVQKWKIGSGPVQSSSFNVNDILSLANTAKSIADGAQSPLSALESVVGSLDFLSPNISLPDFTGNGLSACFGGTPTTCNPPTINIFGGGGSGASALPIFGSILGDTGSIIGAIMTSSGSGYTYPPFVSISDNCGKGYGAVAQSVIENGQVTAIVINSDGEGYTLGDQPIPNDIEGAVVVEDAGQLQQQQNITISRVIIENPGYNYKPGDIVTDNFKNKYDVVINNGSISSVTPINIKNITDRPVLRVISNTGSGAKLKPVFGFTAQVYQGEVKQVIDCVK
jgi:phosphatidylglycerophosphatase A